MDLLAHLLGRIGFLKRDLDNHLLRGAMVCIFAWFGYDKWHIDEIRQLIPLITHGPLIFWTIPLLGVRGTSILLGALEWTFGTLLFLGYWSRTCGVLGAIGSCATFVATVTIFPFVPDGWDEAAGGFPAMTTVSGFLLKDLVLLTVSFVLLIQDVGRADSVLIRAGGVSARSGRRIVTANPFGATR